MSGLSKTKLDDKNKELTRTLDEIERLKMLIVKLEFQIRLFRNNKKG